MTNNIDPFVNLVVEPGQHDFIALKRSIGLADSNTLILPAQKILGERPGEPPKLPRDAQVYFGLLTVLGLYIVYRFTQK